MKDNSRRLAQSWPYPRQRNFERLLRDAAERWFAARDYAINARLPYILASLEQWPQNIILPEVAEYISGQRAAREQARQGFPLHKFAHHGLSSQAMLFNLAGPLMVRQDLAPLRDAFTQAGISWPAGDVTAAFEHEDRQVFNEDTGQPTSIDLILDGGQPGGPALFVEAKLVEREFGGCSVFADGDCDGANAAGDHSRCYLHHIGRRYWERLDEFGFNQGAFSESPVCLLAAYYQFFREVLFALARGGYFILLVDARNPVFFRDGAPGQRGLMPLLEQFVPEQHRPRVRPVTIQQVVAAIERSGRHADWIGEFKRKYGLGQEQS